MNADEAGRFCVSLRGATLSVQWGDDRVYKVGGKMFAASGSSTDSRYSFKVEDERFLELTDLTGVRPAPYLARAKWIQVDPSACQLTDAEIETLLKRSYELVFSKLTKKLQAQIMSE